MQDADLRALTTKLELLIQRTEHLKAQNRQLLASAKVWREERGQLIEKNELARSKVESMIMRLKDLEQSS
jgi:cell division protein ZapB